MDDAGNRARLPTTPDEWREYLTEYSNAYLSGATQDELMALDEQQVAARWLGYEPASEQMLTETEERLGVRLPPSLYGFLLISDGWSRVAEWVERLRPCRDIEWFAETDVGAAFLEGWRSGAPAEPDESFQDFTDTIRHALVVADGAEDVWLLDTGKASPGGEYPAYHLEPSHGECSDPYPSFSALFASGRQELAER